LAIERFFVAAAANVHQESHLMQEEAQCLQFMGGSNL